MFCNKCTHRYADRSTEDECASRFVCDEVGAGSLATAQFGVTSSSQCVCVCDVGRSFTMILCFVASTFDHYGPIMAAIRQNRSVLFRTKLTKNDHFGTIGLVEKFKFGFLAVSATDSVVTFSSLKQFLVFIQMP